MSALGQKRTLGHVRAMSALPPKADIGAQSRNVRFVPEADSCSAAKKLLARLRLLCFRPHEPATLQAFSRPDRVEIVKFRNRLGTHWQCYPRLHGGRENVDVWR